MYIIYIHIIYILYIYAWYSVFIGVTIATQFLHIQVGNWSPMATPWTTGMILNEKKLIPNEPNKSRQWFSRCTLVQVYIYICIYVYIYNYMRYVYIYIYVSVYICIYIYIPGYVHCCWFAMSNLILWLSEAAVQRQVLGIPFINCDAILKSSTSFDGFPHSVRVATVPQRARLRKICKSGICLRWPQIKYITIYHLVI